jgi:nucleotide-binding universal stress UspA family protein
MTEQIHLKRILLPIDFSAYSTDAVRYACAIAERFDTELHLLHVLESRSSLTPVFGGGLAVRPVTKESREAAEEALKNVLDANWAKEKWVTYALADGPPFLEIISYAKKHDVDLIVMSTHGRSAIAQMLMGSVAENVVRKAPCPVLTIRPESHKFVMP